jgi:hypothetical protein
MFFFLSVALAATALAPLSRYDTIGWKLQRARNITQLVLKKTSMPAIVSLSDFHNLTPSEFLVDTSASFEAISNATCGYLAMFAWVSINVGGFTAQDDTCTRAEKQILIGHLGIYNQNRVDDFNRACIIEPWCLE